MSSLRDFLSSTLSDTMLPVFRQTFEDVVFETLNDRKVPSRTDFLELRDLVNKLRGQVSSAAAAQKRAEQLEARIAALETRCAALEASLQSLQAAPPPKPPRARTRKSDP